MAESQTISIFPPRLVAFFAGAAPNDDAGALRAQASLAAQAGMLGVLEALLTSGAALLSPAERAQVRRGRQRWCAWVGVHVCA